MRNICLVLIVFVTLLELIEALPFLAFSYKPRENGYNSKGDLMYEIPKGEYTEENFYGVIKAMQSLLKWSKNSMHENNVLSQPKFG